MLVAAILVYADKDYDSRQQKSLEPIVVDLDKTTTLSGLMQSLQNERLVYLGETHTAFEDHLLQLEVLKAMHAQGGNLALGVEWFQWPFQEHLDAYLAGEISEAQMLHSTGYYDRWRFDYRLYRPIVEFAREQGIPVIALNASKELTDAISKADIERVENELQDQLPDSYDFSDTDYRRRLETFFNMHPDSERSFEGFMQVQLTWDESMALNVASYLKADPDNRMLVLAGSGHIEYRYGIPQRVTRRTGLRGKTILLPKQVVTDRKVADFLLQTESIALPDAGIFGAYLDTDDDGVTITGFTETSTGQKAGMLEDDRILSIDSTTIGNFADLKLAMLEKEPGDEIDIDLERKTEAGETETISLHVELGSRNKPGSPHGR